MALIAALYNGRLALLSAAIALMCADYFLQEPLYSLANDDPREYGDLFVFALLAVPAIKFVRVLVRPRALLGTDHVRRSSSGNFAISSLADNETGVGLFDRPRRRKGRAGISLQRLYIRPILDPRSTAVGNALKLWD